MGGGGRRKKELRKQKVAIAEADSVEKELTKGYLRNKFEEFTPNEHYEMIQRPFTHEAPPKAFTIEQLEVRYRMGQKMQLGAIKTLYPNAEETYHYMNAVTPWSAFYTLADGTDLSKSSMAIRVTGIQLMEDESRHATIHTTRDTGGPFYTWPTTIDIKRLQRVTQWSPAQLVNIAQCDQPGFFLDPCGFIIILEKQLDWDSKARRQRFRDEQEIKARKAMIKREQKKAATATRVTVVKAKKDAARAVVEKVAIAEFEEVISYWINEACTVADFGSLSMELNRLEPLLPPQSDLLEDCQLLFGANAVELQQSFVVMLASRVTRIHNKAAAAAALLEEKAKYERSIQATLVEEAAKRKEKTSLMKQAAIEFEVARLKLEADAEKKALEDCETEEVLLAKEIEQLDIQLKAEQARSLRRKKSKRRVGSKTIFDS